MKILVTFLTAAAVLAISSITLNQKLCVRYGLIRKADVKIYHDPGPRMRIVIGLILAILSGPGTYIMMGHITDPLNCCKLLLILFCLVGAGCVDFRTHMIPNLFPAILSLGGIFLLLLGLLLGQNGALSYVLSSVYAAAASGIVLIGTYIISGKKIGLGDIKMICAVAIAGGVTCTISVIFFSLTLFSITGLALCLARKCTLHSPMALGPFLSIGYLTTMILIMY